MASRDLIAFLKLQQGVRHLIGETQQAGEALADSVRESVVAHERQVAVAQATNDVVNALNGLVDKAHIEMENINGTASAMKESLLKDISGGWGVFTWSWLEAASVYSVKYLWNGAQDARVGGPAHVVLRSRCDPGYACLPRSLRVLSHALVASWPCIFRTDGQCVL